MITIAKIFIFEIAFNVEIKFAIYGRSEKNKKQCKMIIIYLCIFHNIILFFT